jgi:hypothetical protein
MKPQHLLLAFGCLCFFAGCKTHFNDFPTDQATPSPPLESVQPPAAPTASPSPAYGSIGDVRIIFPQ